jgi:hypothetical protein
MTYTELNAPIYGTRNGLPIIVIGAIVIPDGPRGANLRFVCIGGDGEVMDVAPKDVVVDVRHKDGRWHDVGPELGEPEE